MSVTAYFTASIFLLFLLIFLDLAEKAPTVDE